MLKNKCCLYVIISIRFFSITICNFLIEFPLYNPYKCWHSLFIAQTAAPSYILSPELRYLACCRHRRRSGSSIVVVDTQDPEPIKHRTPEEQEAEDAYNMMTMTLDNGPHREMAVDVPDSFIASSKTPPRYPPPRSQGRLQVHSQWKLIAAW